MQDAKEEGFVFYACGVEWEIKKKTREQSRFFFSLAEGDDNDDERLLFCFFLDSRQFFADLSIKANDGHDGNPHPEGKKAHRLDLISLSPDLAIQIELDRQQVHVSHIE